MARSYGSADAVAVGDIVEVKVQGVWSNDPFTVMEVGAAPTESERTFTVKEGYADSLGWDESLDEGMVLRDKKMNDEVRSGARFKKRIEGGPSRLCGTLECLDQFANRWLCGKWWACCCNSL
jgi:hypothetical protein